jgi:hypothetical protein
VILKLENRCLGSDRQDSLLDSALLQIRNHFGMNSLRFPWDVLGDQPFAFAELVAQGSDPTSGTGFV